MENIQEQLPFPNTKKHLKTNSAFKIPAILNPSNQCFHTTTRSLHFENAEISRQRWNRQMKIYKFALIVQKKKINLDLI